MQWTTKVPVTISENPIDYQSEVLLLGSCFAENMAERLSYFKFLNHTNPFGILFHPLAIEKILKRSVENLNYVGEDLFFHLERWHSFEVHSSCSNRSKEDLLYNLNERLNLLHAAISSADHFFITYGTAWVYREKDSGEVVANCHKLPQFQFDKELLPVSVIEESIFRTVAMIRLVNPNANIIFTVSPVRHIKDGFIENQRSKSHLIAAIHNHIEAMKNTETKVDYFPAYEIVMDELRDYRFYGSDMIHPSTTAIDYIWERLTDTYFRPECKTVMKEVDAIRKMIAHSPFDPDSESYRVFSSSIDQRINILTKDFPSIKF